jgi:hypothetical protein
MTPTDPMTPVPDLQPYDPRLPCSECGQLMDAADEPVGLCADCRHRHEQDFEDANG